MLLINTERDYTSRGKQWLATDFGNRLGQRVGARGTKAMRAAYEYGKGKGLYITGKAVVS